jgi:hypothetical protein
LGTNFKNLVIYIQQDRQCTQNEILRRVGETSAAVGKTMIITYFEFVSVALFVQHAERMRRVTLSSVACLVLPY